MLPERVKALMRPALENSGLFSAGLGYQEHCIATY
jgi:hypothetical protein